MKSVFICVVSLFICVLTTIAKTVSPSQNAHFMKIIFMGTPALAVGFLERLHREHEIVAVVTQPDKAAGRSRSALQAPPLKKWANEHSIAVLQPERARNAEFVEELRAFGCDAIAVVAYGQILPREILEMPRLGCLNAHFSLLPRWRGAAPVQHSLLAGNQKTGVTIQYMAQKLDAGDIVTQIEYSIAPDETTGDLWNNLTPIGAEALSQALQQLENATANRTPQDETQITWAPQLTREDGHLNWRDNAQNLHNRVRGTNPWPGAWTTWNNAVLKVWRTQIAANFPNDVASNSIGKIVAVENDAIVVATANGALRLLEIQPEGRPKMRAGDWARGARLQRGQTLGETAPSETAPSETAPSVAR